MTFEWPLALIALVVVPVVIALYVLRERRRDDYAARFTTPTLLPNLVAAAPGWRRHLPLALLLVGLTALVVGVARPHASVDVRREEATVIIAIDTSLSMKAQDVRPSRLGAAENAANAFVAELPKRFRVGVIGFSGRAYLALAPTEDRELVLSALRSLRPGEGTALGDAVALGVRLARQERASDGTVPPTAMLVISDGAQMSGRTSSRGRCGEGDGSAHSRVLGGARDTRRRGERADRGRLSGAAPCAPEPRHPEDARSGDGWAVLHRTATRSD